MKRDPKSAASERSVRLAIVTNIPAPYRIPVYNLLAQDLGEDFVVFFCAASEPNRQWDLPEMEFRHVFLRGHLVKKKEPYAHNNFDVLPSLVKFGPNVVLTTGYNPTHLYAWFYSVLWRKKHIAMTDGWLLNERQLTMLHRAARRMVLGTSHAFVGAGANSMELFASYGVKKDDMFKSHLCADNGRFMEHSGNRDRKYDIMFSGQIIERKIPAFFADVAGRVSKVKGDLRVLVLGDGPLRKKFLDDMSKAGVQFEYAGFVRQGDLPAYYSQARLLLLTTKEDAWGLVANEAMAAGTPVISTPYAGIVNDLLIDGRGGFVMEPDPVTWGERILRVLDDPQLWERLSVDATEAVKEFNFGNAAEGIKRAAKHALEVRNA